MKAFHRTGITPSHSSVIFEIGTAQLLFADVYIIPNLTHDMGLLHLYQGGTLSWVKCRGSIFEPYLGFLLVPPYAVELHSEPHVPSPPLPES